MITGKEMNFSIEARFGKIIAGKKWGVVSFTIYEFQKELGLRIHDIWFLVWLIIHKWSDENPYPSIAKMSRITGYSESYLREISNDLQERGFIEVEQRFREDGGQNTNLYFLGPLFKKIETIIENKNSNTNRREMVALEYLPENDDGILPEEFDEVDYEIHKVEEEMEIPEEFLERQMMMEKVELDFLVRVAKNQEVIE